MGNSSRPVIQLNPLPAIAAPTTRSDIALVTLPGGVELLVGPNSNGFGIRTISANAPVNTQGTDGDIWYQL